MSQQSKMRYSFCLNSKHKEVYLKKKTNLPKNVKCNVLKLDLTHCQYNSQATSVDDTLGHGRLEYLDYNEKIYMLDDINRKKHPIYSKCF